MQDLRKSAKDNGDVSLLVPGRFRLRAHGFVLRMNAAYFTAAGFKKLQQAESEAKALAQQVGGQAQQQKAERQAQQAAQQPHQAEEVQEGQSQQQATPEGSQHNDDVNLDDLCVDPEGVPMVVTEAAVACLLDYLYCIGDAGQLAELAPADVVTVIQLAGLFHVDKAIQGHLASDIKGLLEVPFDNNEDGDEVGWSVMELAQALADCLLIYGADQVSVWLGLKEAVVGTLAGEIMAGIEEETDPRALLPHLHLLQPLIGNKRKRG